MSKTNMKNIAKGRSDVFAVDPRDLHIKPDWNSRSADDPANQAHIAMLADSIFEVGVRQPLTVYLEGEKVYVSDGHCRLAATMLAIERGAEIKAIPVRTEDRHTSDADKVFSQIVRNSGKPLSPFEQGRVFKRLLAFHWSTADIAKKAGISQQTVMNALELQAAPEPVQAMVRSGEVSATLATQVLRESGAEAPAILADAKEAAAARGSTRTTRKDVGAPRKARAVTHLTNAARDLHDALVDIVDRVDRGDELTKAELGDARAALAKARGEQVAA